jgi:2-polyprenyl-3-methyl-5-hydroxy-6-metoxy-1,4-benzoquinol methylase
MFNTTAISMKHTKLRNIGGREMDNRKKYEFLFSLKLLEYEINELIAYSKNEQVCFELLKNRMDYIARFITNEENRNLWCQWGTQTEIEEQSIELRESIVKALCDLEKYQSVRVINHESDISNYLSALSHKVKDEIETFNINDQSNVLFIGSGALPTSALTIVKETRANMMCLDIDEEAITLAEHVTKLSGLQSLVHFSTQKASELSFIREASHVIIASLVKNKAEVLEELEQALHPNAKIILRYGNGLKSLFNYPFEKDLSKQWNQTKWERSKDIYDTVVLERCKLIV